MNTTSQIPNGPRPSNRIRNAAGAIAAAIACALAVSLPAAVATPPNNDAFTAAIPLAGASGSVSGTNVEATRESGEPRHNDDLGGRSVWYRWTAPATAEVLFETCDSGFDTVLAAYAGSFLDDLAPVASNDDACDVGSAITFTATAGRVYSIAVDGYRDEDEDVTATGTFVLRWQVATRPANDDFLAAERLAGSSGTVHGWNMAAGHEQGERLHGRGASASIWYVWTAAFAGTATIDTCGSTFDTLLAVYTGDAVSALAVVERNDDGCGGGSRVRFATRPGTAYRIAVDGTGSRPRGFVVLSWSLVPRPANDDFESPRRLTGRSGSVTGSNAAALAQPGEGRHWFSSPYASLWYVWRAPRTMGVTFETCHADFDTVLAVYRGTALRRLADVDANDDGCGPGLGSHVDFLARQGVEYRIAVDGLGSSGVFRLVWSPAGRSAGPCSVPDVGGLPLGRARAVLERADCRVGRIVRSPSAIVPAGSVITQFPPSGRRLPFLSRIALEVSTGRRR